MNITISDTIRQEMRDIYTNIKDLTDDDILNGPLDKIIPFIKKLDEIKFTSIDSQSLESIQSFPTINNTLKTITNFIALKGIRIEMETSKKIMEMENPWETIEDYVYFNGYKNVCDIQVQGAGLNRADTIVHLGSGPLPMTLILLYKYYGINGIGIERDKSCYEHSAALINKLGYQDNIKILHGDHFLISKTDNYKHILIGFDAEPKNEIFNHLSKVITNGCSISYRFTGKNNGDEIYFSDLLNVPVKKEIDSSKFKEYLCVLANPPVACNIGFAKLDSEK